MAVRCDPVGNAPGTEAHVATALVDGPGQVTADGLTVDASNPRRFFASDIHLCLPNVALKDAALELGRRRPGDIAAFAGRPFRCRRNEARGGPRRCMPYREEELRWRL